MFVAAVNAGLLLWVIPGAWALHCDYTTRQDTTNYGTSVDENALASITPFAFADDFFGVIAFDEDHCIQMCCEEESCVVATFDTNEVVCYLKGPQGLMTENYVHQTGYRTHTLTKQRGEASPMEMEPTECRGKRGVAFDFKDANDLDALAPGMAWMYNWSPGIIAEDVKVAQAASGVEYIPMIWGEKDMEADRLLHLEALGESSHLLGFNEPNFGGQGNLTPAEAAEIWPTVKDEAGVLGADIVSPAVNFCGGDCNREDPILWLDEFFGKCGGAKNCRVTAIAVHSFTCEIKWLNKILHGYLKYGLPLWLTEFACADEAEKMNEAAQASYLADAIKLLELHPAVARYAWFTGRHGDDDSVHGSDLLSGSGELTQVGEVFVTTYQDLQRCDGSASSPTPASASSTADGNDPEPSTSASPMASDDPGPSTSASPMANEDSGPSTPASPMANEDSGPSTSASPMASDDSGSPAQISVPGTRTGSSDVDPDATEITNVVIENVGGTGTYKDVVYMVPGQDLKCPDSYCVQEEVEVSGPLAPFDEGVSVAFRGPMNIHNIVWYEGDRSSLSKTSTWTPSSSDNLVFMTNLGGVEGCSGEWTICGGNSQSYADASGLSCANTAQQFDGRLEGDASVNIMTSTKCTDEAACGFYRDTAMEGWKGGDDGTKVMVFEVDMPHCETEASTGCEWNRPAVWALNSKVVRTAQYGCNCRGMGGNGGCGEFDIVEAVGNTYSDMLFTTVYDFKGTGAPGELKYFLRPSAPTHYAAVFRGGDDAYLQVVQLADFDYSQTTLSGAFLDALKLDSKETHDIYRVEA